MVEINAERLRNVGTARKQMADLLDDAQLGKTTHVLRGSRVVAHLLPPNALVIQDDRVLQTMVVAAAQEAIAAHLHAGRTHPAPQEVTDFTTVLRWLKSNPTAHLDALALYVAVLTIHIDTPAQGLSVESVIDSLGGPSVCRADVLTQGDVESAIGAAPAVLDTARQAANDPNIFSPLTIQRMGSGAERYEGVRGAQRHGA
ncbi:hypothetical protein [Mycobacteroides chelonae]|nr:hypothetical protein [Mycobacteroides chelonae]